MTQLPSHVRSPSKPSAELTVQNYGQRFDYGEHRRTAKYSVPVQSVAFVVDSEQRRTGENNILAEGVVRIF